MEWLGIPNMMLFGVIVPILVIWEAVWKGIALWRAGGNRQLVWFICLFIFNTVGILSIIYIFGFSKKTV
jgi:methionyl-tRNA synthetase